MPMSSRKPATAVVVVAVLLAGLARVDAALIGHQWVEVDNATFPGSSLPTGLADGTLDGQRYRTFDLFITSDTPAVLMDSGVTQSSGSNSGLSLGNAAFFQRSGGGALPPTPAGVVSDPLLQFDSFVGFGGRAAASILVAGAISFDAGAVLGTWATSPGTGAEGPDVNGRIFFGRFTVSSATGFGSDESALRRLSGVVFVFPQGATSGQTVSISNAFAIPSPAGAAVFALAVGLVARRRR